MSENPDPDPDPGTGSAKEINWRSRWQTEPKNVLAVYRFYGEPGRETEAAEAWAFQLTYYFLRGVGEAPKVEYESGLLPKRGVYTCTGLMTTTHPGDPSPVTLFNQGDPSDLNFVLDPHRQKYLRDMYPTQIYRYDGRELWPPASSTT